MNNVNFISPKTIAEQVIENTNDIKDIKENENITNEKITEIEENVEENTQNISTITNIIENNFESYGRYRILKGTISNTDNEVRFNMIEDIPLDPKYVEVSLEPNNFYNIAGGKITFNIVQNGIVNSGSVDLTISLRIFLNNIQVDKIDKLVKSGETQTINYDGTFTTNAKDEAYATIQITEGEGTLESINDSIIRVDFKSSTNPASLPTSKLIVDITENPNEGANPYLKNGNEAKTETDKLKQSSYLTPTGTCYSNVSINLNDSFKNWKFIQLRLSIEGGYRIYSLFATGNINIGDNILLENGGILILNSETNITYSSSNDNNRICSIIGVEKI